MDLKITKEWMERHVALEPDCPSGLLACSPELWESLLKSAPQQVVDVEDSAVE